MKYLFAICTLALVLCSLGTLAEPLKSKEKEVPVSESVKSGPGVEAVEHREGKDYYRKTVTKRIISPGGYDGPSEVYTKRKTITRISHDSPYGQGYGGQGYEGQGYGGQGYGGQGYGGQGYGGQGYGGHGYGGQGYQ